MKIEWTSENQGRLREIMWKTHICGCGSGTTWGVIQDLLRRAQENDLGGSRTGFYEPFPDASPRWSEFGAHMLDVFGFVDHGTAIGWPWLNKKGKLVIDFLDEFGIDEHKWPEWATSE